MKSGVKIVVAVALLLLSSFGLSAKKPVNAYFGVRATYDCNTSTTCTDVAKFGNGGSLGLVYHGSFAKRWFFEPGVYLGYNTIGLDGTVEKKYTTTNYNGNIELLSLRVPLIIGLDVLKAGPFKLMVYTGPMLFVNFKAQAKYYTWRGSAESQHFNSNLTHSGMDAAWSLGIGADVFRHWHVHIEGSYSFSRLGRISEAQLDMRDFNRAMVSVGVGYNF